MSQSLNSKISSSIKTQSSLPNSVRWSIKLFWIGMGLSIISMLLDWKKVSSTGPLYIIIPLFIFSYGMSVWIVYKILKRKNWARILYLIMTILGLLPMDNIMLFTQFSLMNVLNILILVLSVVSVYLLFTKESSIWFKKLD